MLVLQGGGALGAYQVGVYQAMHEAGIEPDWVIGTSIGAINAALIAGNAQANRMSRLQRLLGAGRAGVRPRSSRVSSRGSPMRRRTSRPCSSGIPAFFTPNPMAWLELARAARRGKRRVLHRRRRCGRRCGDLIDLEHLRRAQDPAHSRRGQRAQRRDALFRQPRRGGRHRPRARVRRAAAGVPRRAHRRRSVLGRRHLFEHADRGGARRQAAPGFGDLHRQHVEPRGPGARCRYGR